MPPVIDFKSAKRKGIAQQLRLLADQVDKGEVAGLLVGAMLYNDDGHPIPLTYEHGSAPLIAGIHTFLTRRVHRVLDDLEGH